MKTILISRGNTQRIDLVKDNGERAVFELVGAKCEGVKLLPQGDVLVMVRGRHYIRTAHWFPYDWPWRNHRL